MDGITWFFARRLLSTSPTLCFKEIQVSKKIRLLPSGTFRKLRIRHSISIVERAINWARERWTLRAWWTGLSSSKLIIPPSSDAWLLQFITEIVKLCLQHDFESAKSASVACSNVWLWKLTLRKNDETRLNVFEMTGLRSLVTSLATATPLKWKDAIFVFLFHKVRWEKLFFYCLISCNCLCQKLF